MRENRVKRALKRGEVVVGTMVSEVRSPAVAQMMATAGFQYIYIDMEHSAFSIETVADMIVACRAAGIASIIRTPGLERCILSRPLDAGADGLLIPQVETREEVEKIIEFTKYTPMGKRGTALRRMHSNYAKVKADDYMRHANEETMIVIQIESARAIEDLDDLLSVEGVDAAFVGPFDLSQSLGIPGEINHPKMLEAIQKVITVANKYGVAPGIHVFDVETAKKWIDAGMRLLAFSNDINMIVDTGSKGTSEIRQYLKERR